MTLLGYLLVLTGVLCCIAAPASDSERPKDSCKEPQRFLDKELQGEWNEEFYAPGTLALYSCRPGYIRLGAIRYVCTGGKWETIGTGGQCKRKSCGHPGDIEFGTFELKNEDSFVFGAIVEYTCNEGYQMISKHRTRECSATGWTNYRPECEVRFCPPVQVGNNVNLLTTSYEEEYSVGQVIRFECKNTNQKLNGASEIFCTSEGDWNAPPPTCEEIKCSPPQVVNGKVNNPKPSYKDKETLEFSCENRYKPSATTLTCTKYDWSPTPICEEIVCYRETVKDGTVEYTKEMYRFGDTVTLICKEGYQIEYNPDEPRKCTANGWNPPLKCISKKCSRPIPQNARIDGLSRHRFPMTPGYYNWFYYYCDSGFLSSEKTYYGKTSCTKTGWNPEPKCYKKCNVPPSYSINANIIHTTHSQTYIEGEKLQFQCYKDFKTSNGQTTGEMECHPDGYFLGEKCSKTCQKPKLVNGEYETNENVLDVGAYLVYKCEEGFISSDNKAEGISRCSDNGWQPKPDCRGIFCTVKHIVDLESEETTVRFGNVVRFKCPENWILEGSSSLQCFHYGWSSAPPICRDETHESLPILDWTSSKESKCPPIPTPLNAQVINPKPEYFDGDEIEIKCDSGYQLYGSEKGLCKDGKWQSPPWCIKKNRCESAPPQILNGEISEEFLANQYYSGSTVKYICADGYRISGSDESKCLDGKWLPTPTCEGNPCGKPQAILNGRAEDGRRQYKHRERAAYVCDKGYKLSQTEPATCYLGKWTGVPQCIYSACRPPPKVTNGILKVERKATYLSGERAIYECARGFTMGQNANYITCEDSVWTEPPICRAIGQTCGAPPVVQFGDITEIKQRTYSSGSSVIYKCANYYKLEGNNKITCKDGEWEKEPVCREPCTVKEIDMQQNNIQRKWVIDNNDKTKKLYSEHFDNMTFECRPGYEISDPKLLRIQCLDGVLKYPRCLKEGSCVLEQTEMANNNIRYIKNTEIENGQTIEFECVEGLKSQNSLQATCKNKQIKYPKCSAGQSCPPPDISNAILSPELQNGYESGSLVNIECKDTFKLSGHTNAKCENGNWIELPQCLKHCTLDPNSLERNHIELLPNESAPEILEHGTEVNVKCKATFKRQGSLIAVCNDGVMKYQRCFSGGTCRIIQNDLDTNFLELDERHENEVFFEEGETVTFKCKTGYRNRDGLTGTCAKSAKNPAEYILTYPTCEQESAV